MPRKTKYFNGDTELTGVYCGETTWGKSAGGLKADSKCVFIGRPFTGPDCAIPVTRIIYYDTRPSLHKCDARCMGAKGHNCECSCGGKNHGINR